MTKYTILTNDGETIPFEKTDLLLSELIRTMVYEDEADDTEETIEIPLPNVSAPILHNILTFTRHYTKEPMAKIPRPLPSIDLGHVIDSWYVEYIESIDKEQPLHDLIKAADYLDIEPLIDLACARVAVLIRDKEPTEIKKVLGITTKED
jgi:S-phase kinase-associated protein 1